MQMLIAESLIRPDANSMEGKMLSEAKNAVRIRTFLQLKHLVCGI